MGKLADGIDPGRPENKLVLIVEDDECVLELMEFVVRHEGFRAAVAPDGEEALKMVPTLKPDLVILDMMLPRVGGLEVLRELQATPSADVPVVVVTGRFSDAASLDAIRQEPNVREILSKPVRSPALAALLHRLLGTSAEPRPASTPSAPRRRSAP